MDNFKRVKVESDLGMDNFKRVKVESDLGMDNFKRVNVESDLGMDNFQTVESDLGMDNFQTVESVESVESDESDESDQWIMEFVMDESDVGVSNKFFLVNIASDSDLSMDSPENRDGDYAFILTCSSESSAESTEESGFWPTGYIAWEIFSVKINRPGSLSGSIFADNRCDIDFVIFNNKRNDNKELQYNVKEEGGDLLLTGPDAIVQSYDTTFVHVDLVHKTINSSSEVVEHPLIQKGFMFDRFGMESENLFNRPLINRLASDDGKLTLTMYSTVFSDAAEASVEVKLLDESRSFGVYGSIKASNDMFPGPHYRSILFLKDRNDSVLVERGQPIQLLRSIVAAPCWHNLIICVNLTSEDAHLPSARITFPVKFSSESVMKINSQIQVKVTWKSTYF